MIFLSHPSPREGSHFFCCRRLSATSVSHGGDAKLFCYFTCWGDHLLYFWATVPVTQTNWATGPGSCCLPGSDSIFLHFRPASPQKKRGYSQNTALGEHRLIYIGLKCLMKVFTKVDDARRSARCSNQL